MPASRELSSTSYEQVCGAQRWALPARYSMASDVCEKHPRDKRTVWESRDGPTGSTGASFEGLDGFIVRRRT